MPTRNHHHFDKDGHFLSFTTNPNYPVYSRNFERSYSGIGNSPALGIPLLFLACGEAFMRVVVKKLHDQAARGQVANRVSNDKQLHAPNKSRLCWQFK